MNRVKKIIRNIVVIAILLYVYLGYSGLYLSPLSAHENSERSIHYGPSEIVHIKDFEKGKYILGKYDKWISCNTVNKKLFVLWGFGDQVTGFENDKSKTVDYTWNMSHTYYKLYGIINDDRIKEIEITLVNGERIIQTEFFDDFFLFTWKGKDEKGWDFESIIVYDLNDNVIFSE